MKKFSDLKPDEKLVLFQVSLNNAKANPEISALLAENGYGTEKLDQGLGYLSRAIETSDNSESLSKGRSVFFDDYSKKQDLLDYTFSAHRSKALTLFEDDKAVADKLSLQKRFYPKTYVKWMKATTPHPGHPPN